MSALDMYIQDAAQRNGIDPQLLQAIMAQESGGNVAAQSPAGAVGAMQVLPSTAAQYGDNASNPMQNVDASAQYLANALKANNGNIGLALKTYHGGPNQQQWGPKTNAYAQSVLARYQAMQANPDNSLAQDLGDPQLATQSVGQRAPSVQGASPTVNQSSQAANQAPQPDYSGLAKALGEDPSFLANPSGATPSAQQAAINRSHGTITIEPDDTPSGGILNGVEQGLYGATMGLVDPAYGLSQLVEHGAGELGLQSPQQVADYDKWLQNIQNNYQLNTQGSTAAGIGHVIGAIAPMLIGDPENALLAPFSGTSAIGKGVAAVGNGMLQGAAFGAMAPVQSPNNFAGTKMEQALGGGLVGGALPLALGTAGGILGTGGNILTGLMNPGKLASNALVQTLRGSADPVLANAAASGDVATLAARLGEPSAIPGVTPTTEQVAGGAQPVLLAKALRQDPAAKAAYANQMAANNEARLNAVDNIAQGQEALNNAIQARRDAMQPSYDALAQMPPVNVQPILDQIAEMKDSSFATDPVINGTLNTIKNQIAHFGEQVKATTSPILGANGQPLPGTPQGPLTVRPDLLDGIQRNLRQIISGHASNGAVASVAEAGLNPLKQTIINTLSEQVPGYSDILSRYRQLSQPINDMEAAQEMQKSLASGGLDANGNPMASTRAWVGGVRRANSGQYPLSPSAANMLNNIAADVQRSTISNSVPAAGGGSDTAGNLAANNALLNSIYGRTPDSGVGTVAGLAGWHLPSFIPAAWAALKNAGSGEATNMLANAMLNPQYASNLLMKNAKYIKPAGAPAGQMMNRLLSGAKGGLPSLVNHYQTQQAPQ